MPSPLSHQWTYNVRNMRRGETLCGCIAHNLFYRCSMHIFIFICNVKVSQFTPKGGEVELTHYKTEISRNARNTCTIFFYMYSLLNNCPTKYVFSHVKKRKVGEPIYPQKFEFYKMRLKNYM